MKDQPIKLSRVIAICLIVAVVTAGIVRATSPTQPFTINRGVYPGGPSFTIWEESGTYFAKNSYGVIAYTGTDFLTVCNNALSSGGEIVLSAGTFYMDGSGETCNIRVPSNTVFRGQGKGVTKIVLIGDAYTGVIVNDKYTDWLGSGDNQNITVSDMTIIDTGDGGTTECCINFNGVDMFGIDNVETYFGKCFTIDNCNNGLVSNCFAHPITTGTSNHLGMGKTNNTKIVNNWIYGATIENIYVYICCNVTIEGNHICDSPNEGIDLKSGSENILITGNSFSNNSNNVYVGCPNTVVSSNTFYGGINAIVLQGTYGATFTTITANTIWALDGGNGVMIEGTSLDQHNTISSNTFYDCGWAIRLKCGANLISNNAIYGGSYGIELRSSSANIIVGNRVVHCVYGIWEYSSGTSDYNLIIGNGCSGNTNDILTIGANTEVHSCFNGTDYIT